MRHEDDDLDLDGVVDFEEAGPEEGDYATEDHRRVYVVGTGRTLFVVPAGADFNAYVREYMEETKYWPNVWFISDHGNAHLLSLDS